MPSTEVNGKSLLVKDHPAATKQQKPFLIALLHAPAAKTRLRRSLFLLLAASAPPPIKIASIAIILYIHAYIVQQQTVYHKIYKEYIERMKDAATRGTPKTAQEPRAYSL